MQSDVPLPQAALIQDTLFPTGFGRQQEGLHYPCQNKRRLQLHNLCVVFDKLRALHVCLKASPGPSCWHLRGIMTQLAVWS